MPDPQETTSAPSSAADPVPVLNYDTPEPQPDAWQRVRAALLRVLGVIFLLLGGVISFYTILAVIMMLYDSADENLAEFVIGVIALLLLDVVMLSSGIRWIFGKKRQPQLKRGDDE